jgi:hypothetical protein
MFQGGQLALHIGIGVTRPAPPEVLEQLQQATVTLDDAGRSGFQLTFNAARDRQTGASDFPIVGRLHLKIGTRVQITALLNGRVHPLMDGIVTNHQLAPSRERGQTTLTVTGEDVTVMLDLYEVQLQLPAMPAYARVNLMLAPLAAFGVAPLVVPSPSDIPPLPTDSPPTIDGTFLSAINALAGEWNYIFAWQPGFARGQSFAYFGPKAYVGVPQRALTFGMGGDDNVKSLSFTDDGTKTKFVYGFVKEENTGAAAVPVVSIPYPLPLEAVPATVGNLPFVGLQRLADDEGGDVVKAYARATAQHWQSVQGAATAQGELDTGRYGGVLKAHELVEVRGAGRTHDGAWYVKGVTHTLARGSWTQAFNLERSGTVSILPRVLFP